MWFGYFSILLWVAIPWWPLHNPNQNGVWEGERESSHCMRSLTQGSWREWWTCKTKIYSLCSNSNKTGFVLRIEVSHLDLYWSENQWLQPQKLVHKQNSYQVTTHPLFVYSPLLHPPNKFSIRCFYFGFYSICNPIVFCNLCFVVVICEQTCNLFKSK